MSTFGPVSRPSVPDQVFTRLCDLIISGHYAVGERLPTQRALSAEFGVNMASVREAVKRLEQLRLVEVRHGDATRVLDWQRSGMEALPLLNTVDEQVVRPLFEARRLVLGQVAGLAAERRSDEEAERIVALAEEVAPAPDDETAQRADWAFVTAIVEASQNLIFQLLGTSVREMYLTHAEDFIPLVRGREELAPLYVEVASAIAAGDRERAITAMYALTAAHEARMAAAVM